MHFLVTGGGGFLGRYIVEALVARGDRVRSLGRGEYPELAALGVEVHRGDITRRGDVFRAVDGVDCVIHAAALAGLGVRREPFEATNLRGTQHVIDSCRIAGVPRLVFTSSPSVVFAGRDQRGVSERAECDFAWLHANAAHYSHTKALAERAVLEANDDELRTCALRPHLIWGPRDAHLIPRLLDRARRGRLRRVGDGSNLVDVCYVENAAAAHLAAADALSQANSPVAGRVYFLSQGEPVNCWDWIDKVLALAGLPPVARSLSYATARRLGRACELAYRWAPLPGEPPMTRFLAAQLARSHWYDLAAARRDLGYQAAVSTAEGMRRLGEWLRTLA